MYKIMFYVGLASALFFLVMSIVLFIKNNVAKLIGDLTGWNAKREKKSMKHQPVEKAVLSTVKNELEAGISNDKIVSSVEKGPATTPLESIITLTEEETSLLTEEKTTLLTDKESESSWEEETVLLAEEDTALLKDEATALLHEEDRTELLVDGEKTTLLTDMIFQVEEDIVVTHTTEHIQ